MRIAVVAVLIATLRIASTYYVYSHTMDEPAHIACGVEWLTKGTYNLEAQHPPLSRIAVAAGPVLNGAKTQGYSPDLFTEGTAVLFDDAMMKPGSGKHELYLATARAGNLPFFWLACAVLFWAAARWMGRAQAALAVVVFTLIPPVLGHAGLATTDMALTACLALAFYALARWVERPTPMMGAFVGFAVGLAVISKFSTFVFLPACFGMAVLWALVYKGGFATLRSWFTRPYLVSLAISLPVFLVIVWGIFRFSWGNGVPAPELWEGIRQAQKHQTEGHVAYLFGQLSETGFLLFYPVAIAVKTPLGILAAVIGGLILTWNRRTQAAWALPVAGVAGILAVGFYSRINIGIRHILPIYCFFALMGAAFVWEWLKSETKWKQWTAIGMLVWAAGSGLWNHPDYLPYFNELAGNEPERILADSDLDWGQDTTRLANRLKELNAKSLRFSTFTYTDTNYFGFPPIQTSFPSKPSPGWNAVSITEWKVMRMDLGIKKKDVPVWPDSLPPTERIGRGIRLYYVPPEAPKTDLKEKQ
ncbi:MAG: glycosyltransferase family 39 protein [Acidobacteriota bacterium]